MNLVRLPNWRERLDALFDRTAKATFSWGTLDCALFSADGVEALTSHDLALDFRGHYDTREGAQTAVKKAGFDSYEDIVKNRLGEPVNSAQLVIGDLAMVNWPETGPCLGIVGGSHVALMTIRGRAWASLSRSNYGFKVG
jgi:hypothetical protein